MNRKLKPGPSPFQLKQNEPDWEKAVQKALGKPLPPGGWPSEKGKAKGKAAKPRKRQS